MTDRPGAPRPPMPSTHPLAITPTPAGRADDTRRRPRAALAFAAAVAALAGHAVAAPTCSVRSTAPPRVVELYTSEGCSSCPPADQWLSTLKGRADVIPLAFHVNYWDRLGWTDRFATPAMTQRQHELVAAAGGRVVYTPQVVVDGRDWRRWPELPKSADAPVAVPSLELERDGDRVNATVAATPGSAGRYAGYWAVVEDGHVSAVRAGENAGETLRHDHVVRRYEPVAAWSAAQPQRLSWSTRATPGPNPRRVVFVVTDAATQRPVQAAALAC